MSKPSQPQQPQQPRPVIKPVRQAPIPLRPPKPNTVRAPIMPRRPMRQPGR
ncbi:MAG TPA: hypothetical protein PLC98_12680 [Anaerolineales bacterium]|nr:hypothetical protein [Anaerolineales bacterium]